jgi:hypothetical protein
MAEFFAAVQCILRRPAHIQTGDNVKDFDH